MTLHVPFDLFPKTVQRMLDTKEVFVTARGYGALATAADGQKGILIVSHTDHTPAAAKGKLTHAGFEAHEGRWKLTDEVEDEDPEQREAFIAAVSYKSAESAPGVWVDAHRTLPSEVQVLRVMYEEFRETGELPDVSFEEFVRLAEPTVVIVSPSEVQSFLDKKIDS